MLGKKLFEPYLMSHLVRSRVAVPTAEATPSFKATLAGKVIALVMPLMVKSPFMVCVASSVAALRGLRW